MMEAELKGDLMPSHPKIPFTAGIPAPGKAKPEAQNPASVAGGQAIKQDKDPQAHGRTKVKDYDASPDAPLEAMKQLLDASLWEAEKRFEAALEAYKKWAQLLSTTEQKRELIALVDELSKLQAELDLLPLDEGGRLHFWIAWCKARITYLHSLPGLH